MNTQPTAKYEFRLEAERTPRYGGETYLHLRARVIATAGTYLSEYGDDAGVYNLVVSAQQDSDNAAKGRHEPYGWTIEYRDTTVNLPRAEVMVATLRRISKRLDSIEAKYGAAGTFGAYVLRVADALGISAFIGEYGPAAPAWTHGQMRSMNPSEAAEWFNARIAEYNASVSPVATEA